MTKKYLVLAFVSIFSIPVVLNCYSQNSSEEGDPVVNIVNYDEGKEFNREETLENIYYILDDEDTWEAYEYLLVKRDEDGKINASVNGEELSNLSDEILTDILSALRQKEAMINLENIQRIQEQQRQIQQINQMQQTQNMIRQNAQIQAQIRQNQPPKLPPRPPSRQN
ncbi:MAG: hypothetical protein HQL29_03775 [Candidatus Omnitrophica bacterium]|nr:hypothetical protein [Candidatus Omnitrophota bacterium]